jgi:hypothetical protein
MSTNLCANVSFFDWANTTILFFTLVAIYLQYWVSRQANYATAYKVAYDILQTQEIRDARKHVFEVLKLKAYSKWSDKDKDEASKVCQSYDAVGQMVLNKMLPEAYIVDNWFVGLRDSWGILKPLVIQYRIDRDYPKNWDDFEYLAKKAIALYGKQK